MKKGLDAFLMCLSMFTSIPCPFRRWNEEARPFMTLFLPLIGAIIGGLWMLVSFLLNLAGLPSLVCGMALCAYPFLITGGIHMDGFLDTVDAVSSWRSMEERRRILKDSHVGSFAVIAACLVMLAQFSLLASVKETANSFTLLLIPIVSRSIAALCVSILRPITVSEYAGAYRKGVRKSHIIFFIIVLIAAVVLGFVFLGLDGFASLAVLAGYLLYLLRGFRSLGGMSGDISGYALVFGELCGIAVYALV